MLKRTNLIGTILFYVGISVLVLSFFTGIYQGIIQYHYELDWFTTITWWIFGFISGLFFIGFSEVIELLQRIQDPDRYKDTTRKSTEMRKQTREHPFSKKGITKHLGETTTQQIYDLYEMQDKLIEEIILTPFEKKVIVQSTRDGEFVSTYDVVSTAGNDAINSPLDKHKEVKEWFKSYRKE